MGMIHSFVALDLPGALLGRFPAVGMDDGSQLDKLLDMRYQGFSIPFVYLQKETVHLIPLRIACCVYTHCCIFFWTSWLYFLLAKMLLSDWKTWPTTPIGWLLYFRIKWVNTLRRKLKLFLEVCLGVQSSWQTCFEV